MLDLSWFRANLDAAADRLATRGFELDREEFRELDRQRRAAVTEGIRQLLAAASPSPLPLSYLVDALSSHDAQWLDELQLLVEQKRRELKNREQR